MACLVGLVFWGTLLLALAFLSSGHETAAEVTFVIWVLEIAVLVIIRLVGVGQTVKALISTAREGKPRREVSRFPSVGRAIAYSAAIAVAVLILSAISGVSYTVVSCCVSIIIAIVNCSVNPTRAEFLIAAISVGSALIPVFGLISMMTYFTWSYLSLAGLSRARKTTHMTGGDEAAALPRCAKCDIVLEPYMEMSFRCSPCGSWSCSCCKTQGLACSRCGGELIWFTMDGAGVEMQAHPAAEGQFLKAVLRQQHYEHFVRNGFTREEAMYLAFLGYGPEHIGDRRAGIQYDPDVIDSDTAAFQRAGLEKQLASFSTMNPLQRYRNRAALMEIGNSAEDATVLSVLGYDPSSVLTDREGVEVVLNMTKMSMRLRDALL